MSRQEWRDQEIFHLEIVLSLCLDWTSPDHHHHGIHSIEQLIKHLLPEHLYRLNVITEYQRHVMYFRLSYWVIRASSRDSTFYSFSAVRHGSLAEPIEWWTD